MADAFNRAWDLLKELSEADLEQASRTGGLPPTPQRISAAKTAGFERFLPGWSAPPPPYGIPPISGGGTQREAEQIMRDQTEGIPMGARPQHLQQEDLRDYSEQGELTEPYQDDFDSAQSMEDPSNVSIGEEVSPTPTDTGGPRSRIGVHRGYGKHGRPSGSITFGRYTSPITHESLPYQQEEEPIFNQPPEESPSDAAFQQIRQQKEAEAAQAEAMKRVSAQREAALRARVMQRPLSNTRNRRRGQGPASRNNQRRGF